MKPGSERCFGPVRIVWFVAVFLHFCEGNFWQACRQNETHLLLFGGGGDEEELEETTFNGGSLGSWIDEERSKLRYVV